MKPLIKMGIVLGMLACSSHFCYADSSGRDDSTPSTSDEAMFWAVVGILGYVAHVIDAVIPDTAYERIDANTDIEDTTGRKPGPPR